MLDLNAHKDEEEAFIEHVCGSGCNIHTHEDEETAFIGHGPKSSKTVSSQNVPMSKRPHLIVETCKVGDKRTILHSSERGRNLVVLLAIYDYGKLKYKNWINEKKKKRCQNMPEIVFFRGEVSEIQCLTFQRNNANPYEMYKNCILLNIVFHTIIVF